MTFCKVNVDTQQAVALAYGVSAMPTFMVFRGGDAIDMVRGANPPALTTAVESAVAPRGSKPAAAKPLAKQSVKRRAEIPDDDNFGMESKFSTASIFGVIIAFGAMWFVSLYSVQSLMKYFFPQY